MEILGSLSRLGCLVVIAWAMAAPAVSSIATLSSSVFGRKRRRQDQCHEQPLPQLKELRERQTAQPIFLLPVPLQKVVAVY